MANIIRANRCRGITREERTKVTTEVDEAALTSPIITLVEATKEATSVVEVAVAVEDTTVADTCKVAITSIKAGAVEAWATKSLAVVAEVDISMEVASTDHKVIMAVDTMGKIMVAAETSCSLTVCHLIKTRKVANTVASMALI